MESLREGLLKNIRQDDKSIIDKWYEWVDMLNKKYLNGRSNLVKGEDYWIDKGVLNYNSSKVSGYNNIHLGESDIYDALPIPPPGLKIGKMWSSYNGRINLKFFNVNIKSLNEIVDKHFEGGISIQDCKNLRNIDLTKYPKISAFIFEGGKSSVDSLILNKRMDVIRLSQLIKKVRGCDYASELIIWRGRNINEYLDWVLPERVYKLSCWSCGFKDYEILPKEIDVANFEGTHVDGESITKHRLEKAGIWCGQVNIHK